MKPYLSMPTNEQKRTIALPIVASVLVHGLAIFALSLSSIMPPQQPAAMTTVLASQADFAAAKDALLQAQPKKTSQTTQITPSDMALMTAQTYHRQAYQSTKPAEAYQELTSSTPSFDDYPALDTNNPPSDTSELATIGSTPTTSMPDKAQINAALTAVKNRIETIWKRYPAQPNQSISFQVNIDGNGNVTAIIYGGGHPDLKESIEAAVYAAAPFSELAGLRDNIKLQFVTEQLISTPNEP